MSAKFAFASIFFALLFSAGCIPPEEDKATESAKSAEEDRSVIEKTPAQLLIGKWKLVRRDSDTHLHYQQTIEFASDGSLTIWSEYQTEGRCIKKGTYLLDGNSMRFALNGILLNHNLIIDKINENRLFITATWIWEVEGLDPDRQIQEYVKTTGDL